MAQITEKELGIIKDRLGDEENLVAKYKLYASMTQDSEMKSNFEQIAQMHQRHYDELFANLK
ncbi:MAG: spore coat protein [Clostridia bacterium]|nr:spore coat protein [Clostridia bacterium]